MHQDGLVSQEEVINVIKRDIEQKNLGHIDDDDCEIQGIEVQNDEIYDLEGFARFKEDIYTVFECYADLYQGEKCLNIATVSKLQNPEVAPHIERLNWLINDLQYESVHGHNMLTLDDIDSIVRQYDEFLKAHYKDRDQKKSVNKLVSNLQDFNKEHDSPIELMKDLFMYLIQKQKYKKFGSDEWFILVNSIHEFLAKLETDNTTADTIKFEKKDSIDHNVAYLEQELGFHKEQNKGLRQAVEDVQNHLDQTKSERLKAKEEMSRLKFTVDEAKDEADDYKQ